MDRSVKDIRNVRLSFIIGMFLCVSVFYVTDFVHAQNYFLDLQTYNPDLEWTPVEGSGWQEQPSYDYGNVVVGESKTATFDLFSMGPSPLWIYVAELSELPADDTYPRASPARGEYTLGAFSFDPSDDVWNAMPPTSYGIPQELPVGAHILIDIVFTPTNINDYSSYFYIASNDSHGPEGTQVFLHLYGKAVSAAVPEPATMLLLAFGLVGLAGVRRKIKK